MGWPCPPLYGDKKSKFYARKKAKAEKKIIKLQNIIVECNKYIVNEAEIPVAKTKD